MHGTLRTGGALERIRKEGLLAPLAERVSTNSFDYDRKLGRTNFVFLAPASFRLNYSLGVGAVLVDSAILSRRTDLHFSDQDIGDAIECLKILWEDGDEAYGGRAKDVETLSQLVKRYKAKAPKPYTDEAVTDIIQTQDFADYCCRNYELSEAELLKRIEDEAKSWQFSLHRYFSRLGSWPLKEEVLVPDKVAPEFLLGYWDRRCWAEWNKARDADAQVRLYAWLEAAANYRWV